MSRSESNSKPPTRAHQSHASSASTNRKETHIPPPIPQWALARRPVQPVQPPQATEQFTAQTPSHRVQPTQSTAWPLASSPSASPRSRSAAAGIPPAPTPVATSGLDSRGHQRGRPKGSKNRADAPAGLFGGPRPRRVEARPNYRLKKKRARQPRKPSASPSPSPRDVYDKLELLFVRFFCEWDCCRAELDSFAKLKKHIVVAHGDEVRAVKQCRWGKCTRLSDAAGVHAVHNLFPSVAELLDHVSSRHLDPILWQIGDGRHGQSIVTNDRPVEHEAYLFRNGHQVTPSIRHQKLETRAELRERQRKLRDTLDLAYANAPLVEESDLGDFDDAEPLPNDPG